MKRGQGSRLWDEEGREYLDYVLSWGALILGHAPCEVVEAIKRRLFSGTHFGTCTEIEVLFAEMVVELFSSVDMVRMVNSGTEATMSAVRLARGYTGRELLLQFAGCYHGHADPFLVGAGSGLLTYDLPESPGIPRAVGEKTIVAEYNHPEMVEEIFAHRGEEIAGVIVEPVAANMGVVPPRIEFLTRLRELTRKYGALLIFDEVITGFRLGLSGAQGYYGIEVDLTTLGKIIGGGLPVGAYGGRRKIMEHVAPRGPVYQAGTLSGNPLVLEAGYATLQKLITHPSLYDELEEKTKTLVDGLLSIFRTSGISVWINQVGSMFTLFFTPEPVNDYQSARRADTSLYGRFFRAMLEKGVYLPPSQFEACFLSTAHTEEDLAYTLEAASQAVKNL